MEIKILCPCGSKYKFEVEPLGGKLPGSVQCPVCGADGTEAGNEILAQAMLEPDAASAPAASSIPQNQGTAVRVGIPKSSKPPGTGSFVPPSVPRSSRDYTGAPGTAPAPAADLVASSGSPAPGMPALPPAGSATRLSVSGGHQAPPVQAPAAPQPLPTPMRQTTAGTAGPKPPGNLRGVVGAVIGGIIGMVIWAGLIVLTETEIGWVAWGVGLLTGYSARLIGRGYSHEMGLAAALAALVAILAGQYLAVRHSINSFIEEAVTEGYDYDMVFAKEAVKQKTDPQIRVFLASQATEEGETMTPGEITAEDIQAFREEMPTYQKMAANQYSRAEYERENRAFFAEIFTTGFILKNTFSLWTILWIFLGVGSAWRLASGG